SLHGASWNWVSDAVKSGSRAGRGHARRGRRYPERRCPRTVQTPTCADRPCPHTSARDRSELDCSFLAGSMPRWPSSPIRLCLAAVLVVGVFVAACASETDATLDRIARSGFVRVGYAHEPP